MTTSVSRRYSMYKVQDSRVLDKYAVNPVMWGFTFYSVMGGFIFYSVMRGFTFYSVMWGFIFYSHVENTCMTT